MSGVAHGALLVAALVAFSQAAPFVDAQEAIPVEMVTQSEFNEIMKGEKSAKDVKPAPLKAEKVADVPLPKPQPVTAEAKVETPAPPPPLRRAPDPVAAAELPKPEPVKAVQPPPRPHPAPVKVAEAVQPPPAPPVKPSPPKVEAKAEPVKENPDDALVVVPKPRPAAKPEPPKVEPPKAAEVPPAPAHKVRPAEKPKEPAPPQAKPLDQVAKLLDQKKLEDLARQAPPPSKPAPAAPPKPATPEPTPTPQRVYDPNSIARLINRDKPQQVAAAAPEVSHTASIGAPTQSAARMSPSLMAALDGLMTEQYMACWPDDGLDGHGYVPEIRVQYGPDGSLVGQPALLNPPADPATRSLADSALRAVRKCNPLKIPAQYAPYYEEWRQRRLRLHPEDRTG